MNNIINKVIKILSFAHICDKVGHRVRDCGYCQSDIIKESEFPSMHEIIGTHGNIQGIIRNTWKYTRVLVNKV